MTIAAGILFVAPDRTALFLKRGPGGDFPGVWCFPGGHVEEGETTTEGAIREAREECGWTGVDADIKLLTRSVNSFVEPPQAVDAPAGEVREVDFTTFLVPVSEQFTPTLNDEHTGYAWAPITEPPQLLHPGCSVALERLAMDELGVARAVADGRLTSPQQYENVMLVAMRITGTGLSYRSALEEYVWRDPSEYLNDEFLQRCNGLVVIMDHPEKTAVIDSKEFNDRIVGTVMLPYIKGDEVWGVVKLYDAGAITMITEGRLSTSPAVVFRDPTVNSKVKLENGSELLLEGKPSLLDHLAICEQGVWDKGGEPAGIAIADSQPTGATTMADETDKKETESRSDATIDKMLAKLDEACSRMDSFGARMDAMEDERKADKARKDEASEKEEEAKADKRKDSEEDGKVEGEAKETVADKSRKDNAEDVSEAKAAQDAKKDEDEKKEEESRKDSQLQSQLADLQAQLRDVKKLLPKDLSADERREFAQVQTRADSVYQAWAQRAPDALLGEDLNGYRRRLLRPLQVHSATMKDVNLHGVNDSAALAAIETTVYADAQRAARTPSDLGPGQLREVVRMDAAGRKISEFHGHSPAAWMDRFGGLPRRARLHQPRSGVAR